MKLSAPLALALALGATSVSAQTFTDPANLRGERPRPSDGRHLAIDTEASGLQQLLRKLNTRASLMLIVAHPDDEDGGMLTLYSRGLGARVAMLTLNRGEGGQNAMTGDFEDALGLLRTQELLAADRYFNVDQMFGTEVDFGFSKTKEESFAKWTHDRVLYDAVRAVRIYRPLVIASVFIGGVTDGHGQHQVSGQIAQEVFNAAGDPKVFPELTAEGILPWQPLKVYARVPMQSITAQGLFDYATGQYTPAKFTNYVTGEVTTTQPSVDVVVHEGQVDPLLTNAAANVPYTGPEGANPTAFYMKQMSYVQFARLGLGLQRSQIGPGVRNAPSGAFDISYHRYGSKLHNQPGHEDSFFDGIDTSLAGVASLSPAPPAFIRSTLVSIAAELAATSNIVKQAHDRQPDHFNLDEQTTSQVGPQLAVALTSLDQLIARVESTSFPARDDVMHELRIKRVQLNEALVDLFNIYISSDNSGTKQIAGQPLHLYQPPHLVQGVAGKLSFIRGYSRNSAGEGLPSAKPADAPNFALGHPLDFPCNLTRAQTPVTRPYFRRDNIEQPVYQLSNPALRNAPATPAALTCWAELDYQAARIQVGAVAVESFVPPVNISLYDHAIILPNGQPTFAIRSSIDAGSTPVTTVPPPFTFDLPTGWTATLTKTNGSYREFLVKATPAPRATVTLHARIQAPGAPASVESYTPACYPGIPCTNFFQPATVRIVPADVKLPDPTCRRIAYIPGTGDSIVPKLISLGIQPDVLEVISDKGKQPQLWYGMGPADLSKYDTIILGVRTYNAHPELHGAPTQALFDYARNGGNVIVQFQTAEFTSDDAPFPLTLGRAELVSDETAPVQLLEPTSPLLNTPNKITPADFNNWVEERGHGFLRTWDAHYTALAETHDPGQAPQRGGLITTQLGKGRWTYCAFALYRQLPEAIPGAYRLFANLLNP